MLLYANMQKVLCTPCCYISIVTYTGSMHHYYNKHNKRGCVENESRRVARYCFECAERGILISWKRMKERRGYVTRKVKQTIQKARGLTERPGAFDLL